MTERERDGLLLDIAGTQREHGKKLDELQLSIDAVDNRISDLRRDLESYGVLPREEATG